MTAPSPAQAEAERLLPCNCAFSKCIGHSGGCPASHRPAVAAALQAKQDEIGARDERIKVLEEALIEARDTFRHYGDLHAQKQPPDSVKAMRNYELSERMGTALNQPASTGGKGDVR